MPITARVGTSDNQADIESGGSAFRKAFVKFSQALPKTPDKQASEWMVSNTDMLIERVRPRMTDAERQDVLKLLYGTGPGALFVEGILEDTATLSDPNNGMPLALRVMPVWMADP